MCAYNPNQDPNHEKKSNNHPDKKRWMNTAVGDVRDIIAYVLLVVGIILLFFQSLYGGVLIGIVVGIYFSNEIVNQIRHYDTKIEETGIVKSIVIAALLFALFISAPAIFVGAAIVIVIKLLLVNNA